MEHHSTRNVYLVTNNPYMCAYVDDVFSSHTHTHTRHNMTYLCAAEMTPIKYRGDAAAKREREVPPYNGFGSEEDSLCSCMALLPKPPKRDFIKFMEKVRAYMYMLVHVHTHMCVQCIAPGCGNDISQ